MKFAAVAATCVLLSSPAWVAADPAPTAPVPLRLLTGATCDTRGGSHLELTPGRYVPEQWWLDHEAADQTTAAHVIRLEAENRSFRASANESGIGWGTMMLAGAALFTGTLIGTQL